ncbi:MFS transporter [Cupriavidus gilardii CR3]|uniref:Tripartite tricarboxylate transporter substrate binding protein n=1 Tax=Cupriavidus gilardii TaxID=82541 RepID=A0A849B7G3_9BURK|nr:tripartite tricarboxylate transporter substrate binding protein [Cupriavidus gilardii]ALD92856.1 MFS transporter [Cupriavidus gilardii CR3]KAB0597543.1 tripartite tricarboxylate transporter substrate binding protein [Cupriavidus gilardii]MCT9014527.1 tripartite tricarboxylate transporter substrate binding protein [Cupriavidus gilardii]MCT9054247.1 tripartite tricarboxylate transporter substrate binding protein [Cupriavidus gilardii]NNH10098.1 tripartite tricarboxylate transporter substrate 
MPFTKLITSLAVPAALIMASGLSWAQAQNYPTRPVTIIVPAPAGGGIDLIARVVGEKLAVKLGQPFIVENRPGASNNLGTAVLANAKPDGYTIGIVGGSHNINKYLFKNLGWDPEKSFEPIVYTHVIPLVFAVNPKTPAKSVPELVNWMKANPGEAKVATSGRGSAQEMAAEMFRMVSGANMLLIPYKGSSAAHPDLVAGRTVLFIDTISAIQEQVKAGNVRALAVSTRSRSKALPNVPTAEEQGLKGYDANTNGGFLAPAGTPKDIVAKLNTEINAALKLPEVRAKLEAAGIEIQGGTPQEYAALIHSDLAKWGKVVKQAGIQQE